ncbi:Uncharacterized protein OBRU01_25620 [Operophtera brumata]|uniref:Uncharacterized protein n=1 Tax=Operophtera brumata TaxID=104452 RepID=A0A0L7K4N7_OPEBR|nr:Uncharacterized protein OBRU01_25620 [Operophtera brumata]
MKELHYLFTILYLQNSQCTIDIDIPEYQYLSQRLTPEECRRLYASLHFATFDLPAALPTAEKRVPNVPCFKLLAKWDIGTKSWEGNDKSHVDVEHRLRQIGRHDLAKWLNKAVFTKLVVDVNDGLETNFSNETDDKIASKLFQDKRKIDNDWTMYDSIMWTVLAGLIICVALIFGRIIIICCKRRCVNKKAKEEEIMKLLSYESLESDQETIYECVVKSKRPGERDGNNYE